MVLGVWLKKREKDQWNRRGQKQNTEENLIEDKGGTSEQRMKNAFFNKFVFRTII